MGSIRDHISNLFGTAAAAGDLSFWSRTITDSLESFNFPTSLSLIKDPIAKLKVAAMEGCRVHILQKNPA